jgi:hypothetical protein
MRDRHWKMLMQATGKQFVMDARFCLGDLLALELHNYVDACSEIVDRCGGRVWRASRLCWKCQPTAVDAGTCRASVVQAFMRSFLASKLPVCTRQATLVLLSVMLKLHPGCNLQGPEGAQH